MKCGECGFENPTGVLYCGMCGARLARTCPACGKPNPLTFRFCGYCGVRMLDNGPLPELERPTLASPPADAAAPSLPLGGERRIATILIADVKSSTQLFERLGSETWVELMNHIFQIMEEEIYRFGGEVNQFRGDGLVAFFGATVAHEDDPERAILSALAIQDAIKRYARDVQARYGVELSIRIGINTGEIIVTSVGDSERYREDTAMGAGIALAARMETLAEPGTVLVSEHTYRLVEQRFHWMALGEVMVKGVSHPVSVYRPLALAGEAQTYELTNPLIGRDAEISALKACIERLRAGMGGVVLVVGERGMGKSLLISEVRHQLAREEAILAQTRKRSGETISETGGTVQTLRGVCRSYDQSQPYAMWLDVLRNWLGITRDEARETMQARLRAQTQALWGERYIHYYPYLAAFLELPLEEEFQERIRHLDSESLRQQYFDVLYHWLERISQTTPTLLAFTDIHWADSTSLALLRHCLPLCETRPLLWLLVMRPDRTSPAWQLRYLIETEYPHRLTALELLPLTHDQCQALIEHMVGVDVLPPSLMELIIEKSEGNPYYVQELLRALIAQGVLVQEAVTGEHGEVLSLRWRVTRTVTSLDLPDTLQSLLRARMDQLAPAEKVCLQMAAVIGHVFWLKPLQALAGDTPALTQHLTSLMRMQFIRERGRNPELGVEYIFKSSLLRDVAYESLLKAQRVLYHRKIAEFLESLLEAKAWTANYALLAHHYAGAGDMEKELHYTLKAAEQALSVYANNEAVDYYTYALALLDRMEACTDDSTYCQKLRRQRFAVLDGRREAHRLAGNLEAMRADALALLPLARQLNDPTCIIDALLQQPGVGDFMNRAEVEAGIPLAQEALALAQSLGDRHREMRALIAIVNQRLMLNDPTWSEYGERALQLARELGDERYEARLLIGMGRIYSVSDQPEKAIEYLEAATALAIQQAPDDRVTQIQLLDLIGLQYERSGDYYTLFVQYQQERLILSREIGHRPFERSALIGCGRVLGGYLGDIETALAYLDLAREIMTGTLEEIAPLMFSMFLHTLAGRYARAWEMMERIQSLGEPLQDSARASLRLTMATLHIALEERESLVRAVDLAEQTCELASSPLLSRQYTMAAACKAAQALLELAQWIGDAGQRRDALQRALTYSQTALDIYQHFGFSQFVQCLSEEILYTHSRVLVAHERNEEALTYLQQAYAEMMRKHDLIPEDTGYRRTFLENIPLHQDLLVAYTLRMA